MHGDDVPVGRGEPVEGELTVLEVALAGVETLVV